MVSWDTLIECLLLPELPAGVAASLFCANYGSYSDPNFKSGRSLIDIAANT